MESGPAALLVLDLDACAALVARARAGQPAPKGAARSAAARRPAHVRDVPLAALRSVVVPAMRGGGARPRPLTVACVVPPDSAPDGGAAAAMWCAVDATCFHAGSDLCGGCVVEVLGDIEALADGGSGSGCWGRGLCVECPGHGFLFSLHTGDNVIPNPRLVDGRMRVDSSKAVRGMQRPYACCFDPERGLLLMPAPGTVGARFASDEKGL